MHSIHCYLSDNTFDHEEHEKSVHWLINFRIAPTKMEELHTLDIREEQHQPPVPFYFLLRQQAYR